MRFPVGTYARRQIALPVQIGHKGQSDVNGNKRLPVCLVRVFCCSLGPYLRGYMGVWSGVFKVIFGVIFKRLLRYSVLIFL